ncbi:MAG TPA: DUF3040 domain-containing protein [Acidimicrobiia bacterium]
MPEHLPIGPFDHPMPLDDHEQRILDEIERQFYEQDPDLAHAVRGLSRTRRLGIRLPLIGVVVGILIVLVSFTANTLLAFGGFVLIVASATAVVYGIRSRGIGQGDAEKPGDDDRTWWVRLFGRG